MSNLHIIKGTRIQTPSGVYICVGVWFEKIGVVSDYEFMKWYKEPTVSDVFKMSYEAVKYRLDNKIISVL